MLSLAPHTDTDFIPKFMCAVNNRSYQWLLKCSTVSSVEETLACLLNYMTLFDNIRVNRFHSILSLKIERVAPPPAAALTTLLHSKQYQGSWLHSCWT